MNSSLEFSVKLDLLCWVIGVYRRGSVKLSMKLSVKSSEGLSVKLSVKFDL